MSPNMYGQRRRLAVTEWVGVQVATLLQPESVARCAASEVLALDHWAHATEAALR
jgi:hypothetical protein